LRQIGKTDSIDTVKHFQIAGLIRWVCPALSAAQESKLTKYDDDSSARGDSGFVQCFGELA
jgi:hypothetical protein